MARWKINEEEPERTAKYKWHVPGDDQQHVRQTTAPSSLNLKPSEISLKPTLPPKESGIQSGVNKWNFSEGQATAWYIFGTIVEDD